ncbi:MAG: M1 family peptidase [Chloroflexales bacterium]|nr:M1 family peptidase [Chloroflexales bacterium]
MTKRISHALPPLILLAAALLSACGGQVAQVPTVVPTAAPIAAPSEAPTAAPTLAPTVAPTAAPTEGPTAVPTAIPAAATVGDPYFPLEGNGGYDVQHYTIELTAAPDPSTIAGTTTIEALAADALPSFNLDFLGLDVSGVTVDGAAATFSRSGQELQITPASPITAGATFTVAVAYAGQPQPYPDPGLALQQVTTGWKEWSPGYFAAVGQPDGSMTWFPSNNHPSDKATYTFRITVDDPNVAAANGVLQEVIPVDEDTKTYVWEMAQPMATELALVAVGPFELRESKAPNGLPIRDYFPQGVDQAVIDRFNVTGEMLVFFEQLLGKYPFDVYGSIVVPPGLASGLETQTLSIFDADTVQAEGDLVIAHELFHQWYGNTVTVADWGELWLHEGFAKYAEALWLEKTQGVDAYNAHIKLQYDKQLNYGTASGQVPGLPLIEPGQVYPPVDPGLPLLFMTTYSGGALALHNLRMEVGDQAFFSILRTFYEEHREKPVVTADFIATAERITGRDLSAVWDTWLYGNTIPADFPLLKEAYTFP